MDTHDSSSEKTYLGNATAKPSKSRRRWLHATHCEAFLVSAFELINVQCGSIFNGPETMHRRTVDGVEVDILLHLKDGREILIFLDGARFHGADPKINGGSLKIASDNERRAALIGPRVEIYHLRTWALPSLMVGCNIFVADLNSKREQARACLSLCGHIWGRGSAEERMALELAFYMRVRQRCADYWFPRLSESVPDERKIKNNVPLAALTDLIARSAHPEAASVIPDLGCSSKRMWNWRCPKCQRVYCSMVGAVLANTKSKGCPHCGGSKAVALENSVEGTPELKRDFIEVRGEPGLRASDLSKRSNKIAAWRCRNWPTCRSVCLDRPRNRIGSTGYCKKCGRSHRRYAHGWVPRRIQCAAQAIARKVIDQGWNVKWNDVFRRLSTTDQEYLNRKMPIGDSLSKWGFKQIQKARKASAQ